MDDTSPHVAPADHDELSADALRRTRELRGEIEETRDEISETVEAIQEKLRPSNLVATASEKFKEATIEKVKNMAYPAEEASYKVASETTRAANSLMEEARRHPVATALIGLGAAWLFTSRSRSGSPRTTGDYRNPAVPRTDVGGADWTDERFGADYGFIDRLRDNPIPAALCGVALTWLATSDAPSRGRPEGAWRQPRRERQPWTERERGTAVTSSASDAARQVSETAQQYAAETSDVMRRTTRRAQTQLQRAMRENPLMVSAGAFAVGAALGLSLPETERENEWMGEVRDDVIDRAQDLARDAASTVQEATGNLAGEMVKRVVEGDHA